MAMHRQHPTPRADLPASAANPAPPVATMTHASAVDVTVCEWTADLSVGPLLSGAAVRTSVGAAGYVDFDAVDSVHESTASGTALRS